MQYCTTFSLRRKEKMKNEYSIIHRQNAQEENPSNETEEEHPAGKRKLLAIKNL